MTDNDAPQPPEDPQGPDAPPPPATQPPSADVPPGDPPTADESYGQPPPAGGAFASKPPRPLLRRDTNKHIAGVAGGLADYLAIDAVVLRIAFVVLSVFGGFGLLLYGIAWVAMPSPSQPQSYLERWFSDTPNATTVIVVAAVAIALLAAIDNDHGNRGVGLGLLLLFGGWLLFRADSRAGVGAGGGGGVATPAAPAPAPPVSTWYGPGGTVDAPPAPVAPAVPPWVAPQRRPRSILGRLTIGVALATVGIAAMFERLGVVDLAPVQYAALGMTVTGLGLVVGAWFGRAYGLIFLGLALVPITLVLSLAPLSIPSGAGELSFRPATLAEVRPAYRLGAGELELDLTRVDFSGTDTEIMVSLGAGRTTVELPDDVHVAIEAHMRAGAMDLFGVRTVGRPFLDPVQRTDEAVGGDGRVNLLFDNGVGEIIVRRAGEEL